MSEDIEQYTVQKVTFMEFLGVGRVQASMDKKLIVLSYEFTYRWSNDKQM